MFFFLSYEGDRVVQGVSTKTLVATPYLISKVTNPAIVQEISLLPLPNRSYHR